MAGPEMPEIAGLDAFYQAELRPWLLSFETRRRRSLAWAAGFLALAAIPVIGVIFWDWSFFLLLLAFVSGLTGVMPAAMLGSKIERGLLERLCAYFEFTFDPKARGRSVRPFRALTIVPSYDRSSLENAMEGEIDGVPFRICEAHLETRHRDSKGNTSYSTAFRGLIGQADFPKRFSGTTIVRRSGGFLGALFSGGKGERVKLEDPDFERRFNVYSDDQVEARYLLTPGFMERVKRLDDLSGGNTAIAFQDAQLFFSIGGGNRFSISLFRNLGAEEHFRTMTADFALIFGIVRELNLATKTRV